jgi:hypothetical protein
MDAETREMDFLVANLQDHNHRLKEALKSTLEQLQGSATHPDGRAPETYTEQFKDLL